MLKLKCVNCNAVEDLRRHNSAYKAVEAGDMSLIHTCKPNLGRRSYAQALCLMMYACEVRQREHCV